MKSSLDLHTGLCSTNSTAVLICLLQGADILYTWGLLHIGVLTKREPSSIAPSLPATASPGNDTQMTFAINKKSFLKCCLTFTHASVVAGWQECDEGRSKSRPSERETRHILPLLQTLTSPLERIWWAVLSTWGVLLGSWGAREGMFCQQVKRKKKKKERWKQRFCLCLRNMSIYAHTNWNWLSHHMHTVKGAGVLDTRQNKSHLQNMMHYAGSWQN